MSELKTDLSATPYFDDYSEDKRFHRILFKPRTAVQARELTQLQTILQNQISRFGTHVFKDGSVVDGVSVTYIPRFDYVHLENEFNGANLSVVSAIANTYLITNSTDSNTAVRAVPVLAKDGFLNAYPDTNRVYLRYVSTGKDGVGADVQKFASGDTLYIYNENQGKTTALDSNNIIDTIDVITSNSTANSIGEAYGVAVSSGIVYQKGFFVRVDPQTITVKDFDRDVDGYVVGFNTTESIVTAAQDTSLNDNAAGFSNFTAPGADRLRLTPVLVSRDSETIANTDNFFSIVEFDQETPSQEKVDPVYNKLGDEFARRTYEESGDYVVKPFFIEPIADPANTQAFFYEVSPGIGYVNGHRVELIGAKRVRASRAITTQIAQNQIITANYGNYVFVDELIGSPNFESIAEVSIYDAPQNAISTAAGATASPSGSEVGKANILSIVYNTGTKGQPETVYRCYVFNIRMNSGKSFESDAKSFYSTSGSVNFKADIVLENSKAVLKDFNRSALVFNTGISGVRTLEPGGTNDTSYTFRQTSTATMAANGFVTFTIDSAAPGGTERLGFSPGALSDGNELDFNLYFSANAYTANLTGTLAVVSGNTTITGSGTSFTTELAANNLIRIDLGGSQINRRIISIANNTSLTIDSDPGGSNATSNFQKYFPSGSVINTTGSNTITVLSNTQFTVGITDTLDSGSVTIVGQYPVIKTPAKAASKLVRKNRLVKIDVSTNSGGTTGPWNLGLPDVYKIRNVYVGATYANTNPDRATWFNLDTGQKDTHYDHARLILKNQYKGNITSASKILVQLDHFVPDYTTGVGFFTVDSYPVDDANTANTAAIQTAEIPLFRSSGSGTYNLRNSIDTRPYKFATANSVANTDPANTQITENPVSNNNFDVYSTGQYVVEVDSNLTVDLEYYLPRIDLVLMNKEGDLIVKEGEPKVIPETPFNETDTTVIGEAALAPFPTLTTSEGARFNRNDLATRITSRTNRRYTMRDIGVLEQRIKRLEYYTVLNSLEQQAKDLTIPSAADPTLDRFKNGIFADPFNSHLNGNVTDFEYNIAIDPKFKVARPIFDRYPIDYQYDANTSANTILAGQYVTLPFETELFISQRFSTKFRNVAATGWQWNGNMRLFPDRDFFVGESQDVNVVNIDFSQPWTEFAASPFAVNYGDWRTVGVTQTQSSQVIGQSRSDNNRGTVTVNTTNQTTTTTRTAQQQIVDQLTVDVVNNSYDFGNYVSNFAIQPYIRSQIVAFYATMKPNTRVYAYFDDVPVSQHCSPGIFGNTLITAKEYQVVSQNGSFGDPLVTDSEGKIAGLFRIPSDSFRVGDRTFMLVNVDNLETGEDAILTTARATFSASNVSMTRTQSVLNTREPQLLYSRNINDRTLTDTSVSSSTSTSYEYYSYSPPQATVYQPQYGGGNENYYDPNTGQISETNSGGGGYPTGQTADSPGKIVCTAMNHSYGFGSFRNAIWLSYASNNLTEYHELGYHAMFLPLVNYAYYSDNKQLNKIIRSILEHMARHRTKHLWKQRKGNTHLLGKIYNDALEPICYILGKYISKNETLTKKLKSQIEYLNLLGKINKK